MRELQQSQGAHQRCGRQTQNSRPVYYGRFPQKNAANTHHLCRRSSPRLVLALDANWVTDRLCGISTASIPATTQKKLKVANKLYYIFCSAQVVSFGTNNRSAAGAPDCYTRPPRPIKICGGGELAVRQEVKRLFQ